MRLLSPLSAKLATLAFSLIASNAFAAVRLINRTGQTVCAAYATSSRSCSLMDISGDTVGGCWEWNPYFTWDTRGWFCFDNGRSHDFPSSDRTLVAVQIDGRDFGASDASDWMWIHPRNAFQYTINVRDAGGFDLRLNGPQVNNINVQTMSDRFRNAGFQSYKAWSFTGNVEMTLN